MKLGVLSDTHQNRALMSRAVDILVTQLHVVHLIHLGDDWEDGETLEWQGFSVSGVPGLWCDAYTDRRIPNVRVDVFEGVAIGYAHDRKELQPIVKKAALLLSGHTHQSVIDTIQSVPHMNPGHLSALRNRGQEATFGLVDITEKVFLLSLYGLDGFVRDSRTFPR